MCTAVSWNSQTHFFGRNLDLERSYGECVTVTPRRYPLHFRRMGVRNNHYAMIGMACVAGEYPLYFDAVNECGLSMAGLNFPDYACWRPEEKWRDNLAPFEMIPWVLGQCADLAQTRQLLERANAAPIPFSPELPLTPLHWMISDRTGSLIVEPLADGLRLWDDPVGVLTNSPPFDHQLTHLCQYRNLTSEAGESRFAEKTELPSFSRGMGAVGLPGDLSSPSRFVRAAFVKLNARPGTTREESIRQFFHILNSVAQPRGCVRLPDGSDQYTRYTSCSDAEGGVYYYTTHENSCITGVDLHAEDLEGEKLVCYPLVSPQQIFIQNGKIAE